MGRVSYISLSYDVLTWVYCTMEEVVNMIEFRCLQNYFCANCMNGTLLSGLTGLARVFSGRPAFCSPRTQEPQQRTENVCPDIRF